MQQSTQVPVLKVENLEVTYSTRLGPARAVRDVSFEIRPGDAVGLVGESGCGKSTLAFAIMNHVARNAEVTGGRILFCGEDMVKKSGRQLNRIRGNQIAMVYQDPMAALNPSLRIGVQLTEVLMEHKASSRDAAWAECIRMLDRVHMPDPRTVMERYRHQLSGGQLQRVVIAMALLTNPALLVMDEPTTSLDVTVEAGILDLIDELKREFGVTILFISHNLGVISRVTDRVAVMYSGELVEQGPVRNIFRNPQHPYTAALLRCGGSAAAGSRESSSRSGERSLRSTKRRQDASSSHDAIAPAIGAAWSIPSSWESVTRISCAASLRGARTRPIRRSREALQPRPSLSRAKKVPS